MSGSQGALTSCAKEMNLQVGHVKWHATGKYDIRGVRGEEVSVLMTAHHEALLCVLCSRTADLWTWHDLCDQCGIQV